MTVYLDSFFWVEPLEFHRVLTLFQVVEPAKFLTAVVIVGCGSNCFCQFIVKVDFHFCHIVWAGTLNPVADNDATPLKFYLSELVYCVSWEKFFGRDSSETFFHRNGFGNLQTELYLVPRNASSRFFYVLKRQFKAVFVSLFQ